MEQNLVIMNQASTSDTPTANHINGSIVAIANQKGGVGKTTTAVNLAAALAETGRRVLLIDMDPQGNATSGLGVDRFDLAGSSYDLLLGELSLDEVITSTSTSRLDLVPSVPDLAAGEVELVDHEQREYCLRQSLRPHNREAWDIILLDCPPSLGLITVNALVAADEVLIPVQTEYYALEGMGQLLKTIQLVKQHLNLDLKINGILLTMYDGRTNLSEQVATEVREHFSELLYKSVIPRNVRLSEAPSYGSSILEYDGGSRGAQAYRELSKEFAIRTHLANLK